MAAKRVGSNPHKTIQDLRKAKIELQLEITRLIRVFENSCNVLVARSGWCRGLR